MYVYRKRKIDVHISLALNQMKSIKVLPTY